MATKKKAAAATPPAVASSAQLPAPDEFGRVRLGSGDSALLFHADMAAITRFERAADASLMDLAQMLVPDEQGDVRMPRVSMLYPAIEAFAHDAAGRPAGLKAREIVEAHGLEAAMLHAVACLGPALEDLGLAQSTAKPAESAAGDSGNA